MARRVALVTDAVPSLEAGRGLCNVLLIFVMS